MPTLSSTMATIRSKRTPMRATSGLVRGRREVVGDGTVGTDGRDGVLEHHVVDAFVIDDQREAIEVLDATLEHLPIHEADLHDEPLATRRIQEHVLNVGGR
jgi:hypothetical protein